MKSIIHSVAALLLLIATASAGTITKVSTAGQKATINANVGAGEELRVFVGDEGTGWSASTGVPKVMQITMEASDQVMLDDGGKGKGFILTMGPNNVFHVPIVKNGQVPFGELVIRPSNAILNQNGVWSFADIRLPDGKLVPISVKVRGSGNF